MYFMIFDNESILHIKDFIDKKDKKYNNYTDTNIKFDNISTQDILDDLD